MLFLANCGQSADCSQPGPRQGLQILRRQPNIKPALAARNVYRFPVAGCCIQPDLKPTVKQRQRRNAPNLQTRQPLGFGLGCQLQFFLSRCSGQPLQIHFPVTRHNSQNRLAWPGA